MGRSGVEDFFSDDEEEWCLEEVEVKRAKATPAARGRKRDSKDLPKTSPKKKAKKEEKDPGLKKKSPKAAAAKKKTVPKEAAASSSCLTPATPKASLSKNLLLKENKEQTLKRVRQELEVCMKEGKQEDPEKEAARQRQIKAKKVTRLF